MASIKDLKRMCRTYDECKDCPLSTACNGFAPNRFQDTIDEIVDKWVAEHLVKTYAMDFFEKFPNAKTSEEGIPVTRGFNICRKELYSDELPCVCIRYCGDCTRCWEQEMKEQ